MSGWIGVDMDGCLAKHPGAHNVNGIGDPVPLMVERVKKWLDEGRDVRIMTARVGPGNEQFLSDQIAIIEEWCEKHLGRKLPITCQKDYGMIELYDDSCIHVERDTGRILG